MTSSNKQSSEYQFEFTINLLEWCIVAILSSHEGPVYF